MFVFLCCLWLFVIVNCLVDWWWYCGCGWLLLYDFACLFILFGVSWLVLDLVVNVCDDFFAGFGCVLMCWFNLCYFVCIWLFVWILIIWFWVDFCFDLCWCYYFFVLVFGWCFGICLRRFGVCFGLFRLGDFVLLIDVWWVVIRVWFRWWFCLLVGCLFDTVCFCIWWLCCVFSISCLLDFLFWLVVCWLTWLVVLVVCLL